MLPDFFLRKFPQATIHGNLKTSNRSPHVNGPFQACGDVVWVDSSGALSAEVPS